MLVLLKTSDKALDFEGLSRLKGLTLLHGHDHCLPLLFVKGKMSTLFERFFKEVVMQWQMSLFGKRANKAISFILSYSLVDFAFQLPFFQLISIALSQAVQQKMPSVPYQGFKL